MEKERLEELIARRDRMAQNYDKFAVLPVEEFEAFHRNLMALSNKVDSLKKNIRDWKWA